MGKPLMIQWRGAFGEGGEEPSGVPLFRTVILPAALAPGKRQGGAFGSAGVAAGCATVPHRDLTGGTRAGGKGECFAICFLGPMRQRGVCAKRLADGDPLLFLGCAHEGAHC